ncbi:SAM-dependent methyltransferase [Paractinoplanes brasiliensis]|uniref:Cyclopropane-fatty-acyl-phospholipid synthase n=1 Tax=Paractinoplanes brasiliensis TaxID=52695 RepID=A0A4R6JSK0_9ACTN|nr:cyclopropane-fatty-acyl-phospholipid synthase family protein [Actinoplanes brasiliensis]TDO39459.1 cyclopropane-fatty-acyl-phospholipid synthase [Actinoplanes brasiliensis]GID32749.1 cyclopropane-fatty-acyl-phospholipid synthase [Actinoplanes brasiliensis]
MATTIPHPTTTAAKVRHVLEAMLQTPLPVRLRTWDGSTAGPTEAPVLVIRHRRALRRLMWQPNELGLARAYVAGEIDVEGDLYDALNRLAALVWRPPDVKDVPIRAIAGDLVRLGVLGTQPKPPPEEAVVTGARHSKRRDREAVSHHYDVGNSFYQLVLGSSMVYSCAYWTSDAPGYGLADAQRDKLDLICRKLGLRPGQRLLDVGCGWGSLAIHAAREYGVQVVAITLSAEQAEYARKQVAEAGLTGQVEIRIEDYRDLEDGPYDAISSVGMAEHVGAEPYAEYAAILYSQLKPGGRLLNHQISRVHLPARQPHQPRSFIDAYVFPDGELSPVGTTITLLEQAGFEVRDVHALREHYARTLRAWVANLEADWSTAVRLTSPGRARVWRLYMAASALAFEQSRIGINQVLAVKDHRDGASDMQPTRSDYAV